MQEEWDTYNIVFLAAILFFFAALMLFNGFNVGKGVVYNSYCSATYGENSKAKEVGDFVYCQQGEDLFLIEWASG